MSVIPLYEDERTTSATNLHFVMSFEHIRQIARILFCTEVTEATFYTELILTVGKWEG